MKTIAEEYIKQNFNVWQLIWENRDLGFVFDKRLVKSIDWMLKRGYITKKYNRYVPNLKRKIVIDMIGLINTVMEEARIWRNMLHKFEVKRK